MKKETRERRARWRGWRGGGVIRASREDEDETRRVDRFGEGLVNRVVSQSPYTQSGRRLPPGGKAFFFFAQLSELRPASLSIITIVSNRSVRGCGVVVRVTCTRARDPA